MRTSALLLCIPLVTGCGENLTVLDHEAYQAGSPQALDCLPNLDGRIDAAEIQAAVGVPVRYLVSPSGEERTVDVAGAEAGDTVVWDWSADAAGDQAITVAAESLEGKWYAGSFPPDAVVTPFDAGHTLEAVTRADDQAFRLLGIASAKADPPEGKTLLVYQVPVELLRFPLQPGQAFTSTGAIEGATLRGLPYAGTDTYEVKVDQSGELQLPQLVFTEAHRVRTKVIVSPAVGAPVMRRQVSYFFECFAEVARAVSRDGEPAEDFTIASEVWRIGF